MRRPTIRELVSLRKDTISHAYELMKIGDERKRRRLAKRVAAGELTLAKLRAITGGEPPDEAGAGAKPKRRAQDGRRPGGRGEGRGRRADGRRAKLAEGVDDLVDILRQPEMMEQIPEINRDNFAKHLTITKLKIENAIAIIRAGSPREEAE